MQVKIDFPSEAGPPQHKRGVRDKRRGHASSTLEGSLKSNGLGSLQGEMDMELGEPQTVLTVLTSALPASRNSCYQVRQLSCHSERLTPRPGPMASSDLSSFSVSPGAESTCTVGPTRLCPHSPT